MSHKHYLSATKRQETWNLVGWEVNDAQLEHLQEHRKLTGSAAVESKSPTRLAPISRDARSPFSWLTVSTSNGIGTKVPLDVQMFREVAATDRP